MPTLQVRFGEKLRRYAIGWPIDCQSGWGLLGLNLALDLSRKVGCAPLLLEPTNLSLAMHPVYRYLLGPALADHNSLKTQLGAWSGHHFQLDCPLLWPLGNGLKTMESPFQGQPNIGMAVIEDSELDAAALAQIQRFDLFVTGSSWNESILRSHGIERVTTIPQGIDPAIFHPAPRTRLFGDRFVVLSGGKLEYRKAQDITIAAFRALRQRRPDALLVTMWHTGWPALMAGLELSGHVSGLPPYRDSTGLELTPWLEKNGIPLQSAVNFGPVANHEIPLILRAADVVVCPSRAEGGTNLVAMEAMACGLPTIFSANTGHLEILDDAHCIALREQGPVQKTKHFAGVEGWGESSVEELLEALDWAYLNREAAWARGQRASDFMHTRTTQAFAESLVAAADGCPQSADAK